MTNVRVELTAAAELRSLLDWANELVCTLSSDGYFQLLNRRWEDVLGYDADELSRHHFLEFVHPTDRLETSRVVAGLIDDQQPIVGFLNRYRCSDGSYRWFDWNARWDPASERVHAIARDVTEHRFLEARRAVTEALFSEDESSPSSEIRRRAVTALLHAVRWELAEVWVRDEDATEFTREMMITRDGDYAEFRAATDRLPATSSLAGLADRHTSAWIERVADAPEFVRGEAAWKSGLGSALGAGITDRYGRHWVVTMFDTTPRPRQREVLELTEDIMFRMKAAMERRADQHRLERADERAREVLDAAYEGVSVIDTAGTVLYANSAMLRLLRCEHDDLVGHSMSEFLALDDPEDEIEARIERRRLGQADRSELPLRRLDGGTVWCRVNAAPMHDDQGHHWGSVAMMHDVTLERNRTIELELLSELSSVIARAERAADAVELVLHLSCERLDLDGGVAWTRGPNGAITVVATSEAWAQRFADRVRDDPPLLDRFDTGGDGAGLDVADDDATGLDDRHVFVPFVDGDGSSASIGMVVHARSVTSELRDLLRAVATQCSAHLERRDAETKLRDLTQQLETRVDERTAELRALVEELDSFTYSVSHDLRAPLRAIASFSHLLREDEAQNLSDEGRHWLGRIGANVDKMSGLIDDLLEYSRSSRKELEWSELDLGMMIPQLARELQTPGTTQPKLRVSPIPRVRADALLARQILSNLLSNAFKFSAGIPHAAVVVRGTRVGDEVRVEVVDRGVGFDEAHADQLFEMFERFHTDSGVEGTGIGLAIVERAVARHGGRVGASSPPGGPTTFWFTLPAADRRTEVDP